MNMLMPRPSRREFGSLNYPTTSQITWKLFPKIIRLGVQETFLTKVTSQAQVYQTDD